MLAREAQITYRTTRIALPPGIARVGTPEAAQQYAAAILPGTDPREHFAVIALNAKHAPIAHQIISIGTLDAALVHPRDVFRFGVLASAAALVLAHTHPSGDPTPSPDDCTLTRRMVDAGQLMGIAVLDHVIIGNEAGDLPGRRTHSLRATAPHLF